MQKGVQQGGRILYGWPGKRPRFAPIAARARRRSGRTGEFGEIQIRALARLPGDDRSVSEGASVPGQETFQGEAVFLRALLFHAEARARCAHEIGRASCRERV